LKQNPGRIPGRKKFFHKGHQKQSFIEISIFTELNRLIIGGSMAILAITKSYGSGGNEIGRSVARLLGYEYVSLRKILKETRKAGGAWERCSSECGGEATYPDIWWSFTGFMTLAQSVIMNYAEQDNKVIMARGASALLRDIPHALRVRITAPVEYRVQEVMRKEDIPLETARLIVKEADRAIHGTMSRIYGEDWNDPDAFDLKFDTSEMSIAAVAEAIENALGEKEKLNTEEAKRLLHLHAVAAAVKAGIATNPGFLIPTLEVDVEKNALTLRGLVHSIGEQNEIEKEAAKLASGVPVTFDFHRREARETPDDADSEQQS
jgi:cytidylate kinase